ncbi:MAG: hypothetical protein ACT4QC_19465 [Planctomycetaceae bacterium]
MRFFIRELEWMAAMSCRHSQPAESDAPIGGFSHTLNTIKSAGRLMQARLAALFRGFRRERKLSEKCQHNCSDYEHKRTPAVTLAWNACRASFLGNFARLIAKCLMARSWHTVCLPSTVRLGLLRQFLFFAFWENRYG